MRTAARVGVPQTDSASSGTDTGTGATVQAELGAVVRELGQAHRDLAALMRAAPIVNQKRLEHGLVSALRAALDGEFRGAFDRLDLETPPDACTAADALSPLVADLLLGATLEAVRNAGRHARGGDLHRRLTLRVALAADESWVSSAVSDDGIGLQSEVTGHRAPLPEEQAISAAIAASPDGGLATPGARSGLLTHGALVVLIGGTLSVQSQPELGTTVTTRVPRMRTIPAPSVTL